MDDTVLEKLESILSRHILTNVIVDSIIITEKVLVEGFLNEAKQAAPLIHGTKYSYRIDIPYGESRPGNQKHIHILAKNGNELFAMNADGTAHDGYHKVQIPKNVKNFLLQKGFTLPPNNIIEFYNQVQNTSKSLIMEDKLVVSPWSNLANILGDIISRSVKFQIIESNLPISEVKMHGKIRSYFTDITPIIVPCLCFDNLKYMIIQTLNKYSNFIPYVIQINRDSNAKYQLFIAWENIKGYQYEIEEVLTD